MTKADELLVRIDELKQIHESDPDLDHPIGSDPFCLYCDEYKDLIKKLKKVSPTQKTSGATSEANEQAKRRLKKASGGKSLYEVTVKSDDSYMIYSRGEIETSSILKIRESEIIKHVEIPKKYWPTTYVEKANGDLIAVKDIITSERSRIISKQDLSSNPNVRHYCYNETPFEYLVYNLERMDLVERFAKPYQVEKTKKFNKTGRVTLFIPTGTIAVDPGEVLLKITDRVIVKIEKDDFEAHFVEQENYVWRAV
jgi:hypothetical protein